MIATDADAEAVHLKLKIKFTTPIDLTTLDGDGAHSLSIPYMLFVYFVV